MTELRPLKPGIYRISSVTVNDPDPGIGGLYATSHSVGETITANAAPPFVHEQNWRVTRDSEGTYFIIAVEPGGTEDHGFSFREFKEDEPIILDKPKKFVIEFFSVPNIYRIRAVQGPIGVDWFVGVSEAHGVKDLVLKSFPVVREPPFSAPTWQFDQLFD